MDFNQQAQNQRQQNCHQQTYVEIGANVLKAFECPVCFESYISPDRKAKFYPCGHLSCEKCMKDSFSTNNEQNNTIKCFMCRKAFKFSDIESFAPISSLQLSKEDSECFE